MPTRILVSLATALVVLSACAEPDATTSPSAATRSPTPSPSPSPSLEPSPSPEPAPSPEPEPGAMPESYAPDDEPAELPAEALVPEGATVTGQWFGFVDEGAIVLVAWSEDGPDFARLPRGFATWRRYPSSPHWRADLVERHDADDAVQEIQASTTDVTADGSDDALVFEGLGGSGACGRWLVVDLGEGRITFRRRLCDGTIEPAPPADPGLVVTESVFEVGDAHCCPSAIRRTTLRWIDGRWRAVDREVTPT